jgi:hypothetical protein
LPGFGALVGALLVALLILRLVLPRDFWAPEPFPFGFLGQQVSADVAIFFFFAGIALLAMSRGIRELAHRIPGPPRYEILRQVLLAAGATAFLSVTLGGLSSYAWESLALDPLRLWRGAAYTLMVWPFFFGLRSLLIAMAPRLRHPVAVDFTASLLVLVALGGIIVLNFERLAYLGILLPIVAIMLIILAGVAAWSRRVAAHPVILIATLESLLLAWILSATLPLIA